MALSGTFYNNVGSYNRIQGEWTATQDKVNNTSTVTLKSYWMATQSGAGAVYSSTSKNGQSVIEAVGDAFTATAGLSNGEKKLINTQTRTITHNADGTFPDLDLSVTFSIEVTLSGTYYGTVSTSGSFALNTIPRESTLAEDPTWRAGEVLPLSINRSSSSFSHTAAIYFLNTDGTYGPAIKTVSFSSSTTSLNVGFSSAEYDTIFSKLAGRSSASSRVILKTYDGSNFIGQTERDGIIMSAIPSHPTTGYDKYQYVTEVIDFGITRAMSSFTHTVRIKLGSFTKTFTGVGTSISWTPTQAESDAMAAQMPNDMSKWGSIEIDTFYNTHQVRTTQTADLSLHIYGYKPVFDGTVLTYRDTNTTTTNVTANDQYIIQNKSTVDTALPLASKASAQGGATIAKYVFKLAGETLERSHSTTADVTAYFSTINASTNQTLVVEAHDSRGQVSTLSKIVTVIPYKKPALQMTAARVNGFEATTNIESSGGLSAVKVAGIQKNDITVVRYSIREKGVTTWPAYTTMAYSQTGETFSVTTVTQELDSTKAYEVRVEALDRFETAAVVRTVAVGKPIFFIDEFLSSIGFGDFPKYANQFLMRGRFSGLDGMFFGAHGGYTGNGIHFPTSSTPVDSNTPADYDKMHMRNGFFYLNGNIVMDSNGRIYPDIAKMPNGYNMVTQRATTAHDDAMLIQQIESAVTVSNGIGYVDITFPTAFTVAPEWIIATGYGSNSAHASYAVYTPTATGCRVYGTRLGSTTSNSFNAYFIVVACGRK